MQTRRFDVDVSARPEEVASIEARVHNYPTGDPIRPAYWLTLRDHDYSRIVFGGAHNVAELRALVDAMGAALDQLAGEDLPLPGQDKVIHLDFRLPDPDTDAEGG